MLVLGLICIVTAISFAIKTGEVELGEDGVYDGAVYITRSGAGELLLQDSTLAEPVPLSGLAGGVTDHGALTGLSGDDHPHYLTTDRHQATHDAVFNDNLPVSTDVGGNITLGGHFGDAYIHVNRTLAEFIQGRWDFKTGLDAKGDVTIGADEAYNDPYVGFTKSTSEASITFNSAESRLEASTHFSAPELSADTISANTLSLPGVLDGGDEFGNPSAVLSNIQSINGIDTANLAGKHTDEDISGKWDFMNTITMYETAGNSDTDAACAEGTLTTLLDGDTAVTGLTRTAARLESTITNNCTGDVTQSVNTGVAAEANSSGKTDTGESLNNVAVAGTAWTESHNGNAVGIAGFADSQYTNRAQIGVYGGLDPTALNDPASFPQGTWAGYFDGDVAVKGALSQNSIPVELKKSNIITVAPTGADFTSIQDAINAASTGEVVLVYPGTYNEQVTVNKSNISLVGQDRMNCIIQKEQSPNGVLHITANNVEISNLTIYNTYNNPPDQSIALSSSIDPPIENVWIMNTNLYSEGKDTIYTKPTSTFGSWRYLNCHVRGTYDILTASGSVWCQNCRFEITKGHTAAVLFFNTSAEIMINNCFIDMRKQSSGNSQMFVNGWRCNMYGNF